jgi:NAD+ diphosphatase
MNETGYWLLRCENRVFTTDSPAPATIFPYGAPADVGSPATARLVGEWQGHPCYAADVACLPINLTGELRPLRALFGLAGAEAFALAGRATQLLDWQNNHRYCGSCGTPTTPKTGELAMSCPNCGLLAYPRISPAVMVLVSRGDELLLARSPHFRPGVYSALAGFVEAGETLEQCALREVHEEVGIAITNLRYFRSQSWPFPNSLMLAFFADYAGGEITPQPSEIEDAGWFSPDALPELPDHLSIARQLIDARCRQVN